MFFLCLLSLFSLTIEAKPTPLTELKESFGETVVPYHHKMGRTHSFQTINTAVKRSGYGPRTFVRSDIHTVLTETFQSLEGKPLRLVYGEGSWGEKYTKKALKPHKTHKKGMFLDIFMPVQNRFGTPVYFPTSKENLFGYDVQFDANGKGVGKNKQYQIDWVGLITLFDALCTHGGDKIKKILIAEDLIPALSSPERKKYWDTIPKTCRNKLVPIGVLGPYIFAGRNLLVDHDDHIHVEFR